MDLNLKKQILSNSLWNFVSSIINRVGGLILTIILSRFLMPEGFGAYSLAMSISLFFLTFSDFGINQAMVRYVTSEINKNQEKSAAYLRYLFRTKFFITVLASLILFLIAYPLSFYAFDKPQLFVPIFILGFYVFFLSIESFFESLLFVKKHVSYVSFKEILFQLARISSVLLLVLFAEQKFKIIGIILSFTIISFLALLFIFIISKKFYSEIFLKTNEEIDKKKVRKFIFFLNLENLSVVVLSQVGIIFLGFFLPEKFVGYYNSALVIIFSISSILTFAPVLLPVFTQINDEKFNQLFQKILRIFFILVTPIPFFVLVLSKYILLIVYGEAYLPASYTLSILSFLLIPLVGTELFIASFAAKEKVKEFSKLVLLSALLSIILTSLSVGLLSKISGEIALLGAAISMVISWFFYFFGAFILSNKHLKIKLPFNIMIKSVISSFFMYLVLSYLLKVFDGFNLVKGIVLVLAGVVFYVCLLFVTKEIKPKI